MRWREEIRRSMLVPVAGLALGGVCGSAQSAPSAPIAIVPIETSTKPDETATVTGALEVAGGRAMIAASGSVHAGSRAARVLLPRRGELRVCARTEVKLAADGTSKAEMPGLLLALDRGAIELSLAGTHSAHSSDVVQTPDFRILVSGTGATNLKIRLSENGDTCIDNAGAHAPYVLVSSVFEDGAYRVQPGQRISFQHGSLHTVIDQEKESCGCPPDLQDPNAFPFAQSAGLEPLATPAPGHAKTAITESLAHEGHDAAKTEKSDAQVAPATTPQITPQKTGFFAHVGAFFRKIFGAE